MKLFNKIINRAQFSQLSKDNEGLIAKCAELEAKIVANQEAASNIENTKKQYEDEINNLKQLHEKEIAELKASYEKQLAEEKAKATKAEVSSEEKAISTLAQIGVNQNDLPAPTQAEDVIDTFKKLSGTKRTEFYRQNRATILQKLGIKN